MIGGDIVAGSPEDLGRTMKAGGQKWAKLVREIGRHIGADSIGYLSLDGLVGAIDAPSGGYCTGCLTGRYPVPVQLQLDKLVLERAAT